MRVLFVAFFIGCVCCHAMDIDRTCSKEILSCDPLKWRVTSTEKTECTESPRENPNKPETEIKCDNTEQPIPIMAELNWARSTEKQRPSLSIVFHEQPSILHYGRSLEATCRANIGEGGTISWAIQEVKTQVIPGLGETIAQNQYESTFHLIATGTRVQRRVGNFKVEIFKHNPVGTDITSALLKPNVEDFSGSNKYYLVCFSEAVRKPISCTDSNNVCAKSKMITVVRGPEPPTLSIDYHDSPSTLCYGDTLEATCRAKVGRGDLITWAVKISPIPNRPRSIWIVIAHGYTLYTDSPDFRVNIKKHNSDGTELTSTLIVKDIDGRFNNAQLACFSKKAYPSVDYEDDELRAMTEPFKIVCLEHKSKGVTKKVDKDKRKPIKHVTDEPVTTTPNEDKPDVNNPDNSKVDNGTPDNSKPDNGTPDNTKPDNDNLDSNKTDNGKPDNGNSTSDIGKHDHGKPDNTIPDINSTDVGERDNGKSNSSKPDNEAPNNNGSDSDKHDNGESNNGKPDNGKPGNNTREKEHSNNGKADNDKPGIGEPENGKHDKKKENTSPPILSIQFHEIPSTVHMEKPLNVTCEAKTGKNGLITWAILNNKEYRPIAEGDTVQDYIRNKHVEITQYTFDGSRLTSTLRYKRIDRTLNRSQIMCCTKITIDLVENKMQDPSCRRSAKLLVKYVPEPPELKLELPAIEGKNLVANCTGQVGESGKLKWVVNVNGFKHCPPKDTMDVFESTTGKDAGKTVTSILTIKDISTGMNGSIVSCFSYPTPQQIDRKMLCRLTDNNCKSSNPIFVIEDKSKNENPQKDEKDIWYRMVPAPDVLLLITPTIALVLLGFLVYLCIVRRLCFRQKKERQDLESNGHTSSSNTADSDEQEVAMTETEDVNESVGDPWETSIN